jgi:glycosyltransferase involved in cell wall biosynthesis
MDQLAGGKRGTLVTNGEDTTLFYNRSKSAARAELGLETNQPIVLVAGHLNPRKDPLLALAAFEHGAPKDALCVFVGRGELREALEQAARQRNIFERIRLIGEVNPEQIASWYAACDVLLLTSHREGRPNVVLEVLASGRPVVASDVGGTGELLAPWIKQMLAPVLAAEPMGNMLAELLADLPEPNTLAAGVSHLTWDASFATLENVLQCACQEKTLLL